MKLIQTGIPGLDVLFKGGIRKGASLLFAGAPGTGKSVAALQFLCHGAQHGEPGLLITSEESKANLSEYAATLGWDLAAYEQQKRLFIVEYPLTQGRILSLETPLALIKKHKIQRVSLDSLTLFKYQFTEETSLRKEILQFLASMKSAGVTVVATAEQSIPSVDHMRYLDEAFLFEGLIILRRVRKGASFERVLNIEKMRGQPHVLNIYPLLIEKGGMKVLTEEVPFSLVEQQVRSRK